MDSNQLETQSKAAFARLRGASLEPSPFMKTRILARLGGQKSKSRELFFWRLFAAISVTACAALAWVHFVAPTQQTQEARFFTMAPYVIHVDLADAKGAELAEIELPEGVHFVSKSHPEVAELRSMKLTVPEGGDGRTRLPFVVSADKPGLHEMKLRIFDQENHVIQERTLSVTFAEKRS